MADIRINDLPNENNPVASEKVAIDGATTRGTTIQKLVDSGAPVASQAEAEAGANNVKRMTPLRVKQYVDAQIGTSIASAAQGSLAATAVQPEDLGTSAPLDVGTTAGTVAAGDDSRFLLASSALQPSNNLSDVADADEAKDNLGITERRTVTPYDFGALRTDPENKDQLAAVQACIDFVRASWYQTQGAFKYVVDLAGRAWTISGPLNFTNIRQPFMELQNGVLHGRFEGANAGKVMLDLSGTNAPNLRNIGVYGDPVYPPGVGILQCKADTDGMLPYTYPDAKQQKLESVWGSGYFSKSAWIGFASECNEHIGCLWQNKHRGLNTYAGIACANAGTLDDYVGGVTSDFAVIPQASDGSQSNIEHTWHGVQFLRVSDVALNILGISKASPGVVSTNPALMAAAALSNDVKIFLYNIVGMTQLNRAVYTIKNINLGAGTFELYDEAGTTPVDTTTFGTFTSGTVWLKTGPALLLNGMGDLSIDNGYFLAYGNVPIVYDLKNPGGNRHVRIKGQWEHENSSIIRFDLPDSATHVFSGLEIEVLNANQTISDAMFATSGGGSGGKIEVAGFDLKVSSMGVAPPNKIIKNASQWRIKDANWRLPLYSSWNSALNFDLFSGEIFFLDTNEHRFYGSHVVRQDDNGAAGGTNLVLSRFSQSPVNSDIIGQVLHRGYNDAANEVLYAASRALIVDPVAGTEDAYYEVQAMVNGTLTVVARFRGTPGANFTGLYLLVNSGGTVSFQPVTLGAVDSGGAGYKVLRVPN